MEFAYEFTLPVPVEQAWSALLDVERVTSCVPGATVDSIDGNQLTGRFKTRIGTMTITYKGAARFVVADETARAITMEGTGKEARGPGTASVTVQARLRPAAQEETAHVPGELTMVAIDTKLDVTGRSAQFDRDILSDAGGKLIARFAKTLSERLTADMSPEEPVGTAAEEPATPKGPQGVTDGEEGAPAGAPPAGVRPAGESARERAGERRGEAAIDLVAKHVAPVAKHVAPVAAGALALLTIWKMFRRRGRHRR